MVLELKYNSDFQRDVQGRFVDSLLIFFILPSKKCFAIFEKDNCLFLELPGLLIDKDHFHFFQ